MSNSNEGCGGTVVFILIIMVFLAAFGFINWSTVGSFARTIVYVILAGFAILVILYLGSKK
jgi:hypothetical protein